jgi:hypothetical protein
MTHVSREEAIARSRNHTCSWGSWGPTWWGGGGRDALPIRHCDTRHSRIRILDAVEERPAEVRHAARNALRARLFTIALLLAAMALYAREVHAGTLSFTGARRRRRRCPARCGGRCSCRPIPAAVCASTFVWGPAVFAHSRSCRRYFALLVVRRWLDAAGTRGDGARALGGRTWGRRHWWSVSGRVGGQ